MTVYIYYTTFFTKSQILTKKNFVKNLTLVQGFNRNYFKGMFFVLKSHLKYLFKVSFTD
nr:MAG TPA: hypothetical protein [Caudoviricetes sp.]